MLDAGLDLAERSSTFACSLIGGEVLDQLAVPPELAVLDRLGRALKELH